MSSIVFGLGDSNNKGEISANSSYPIPCVRVTDIILNENHPEFEDYGGWNGIGTIFYNGVEFPFGEDPINVAIPLFPNLKQYPLINEIVPLLFLTSWDAQTSTSITQAYYLPSINIWNSQHHNALPNPTDIENNPPSKSQKDYENSINGSSRDVRRVYDNATDIDLGEGFNEQINTHPLKFFAGDNLIEGRWGNSIRLGSIIQGNINYPITIIRNGQPTNINSEGWVPITENINEDKSSIYLTDTQKINIEVASKEYNSYTNKPESPQTYKENQIILNSGRLLFNSKTSDILLSSNKSINLNSVNSVNIDTKTFVISTPEKIEGKDGGIYLGGPNVTQPLLRGDATLEQLNAIIEILISFFNTYGQEPFNNKAVSSGLANTVWKKSLKQAQTKLNTLAKSKIGYIK